MVAVDGSKPRLVLEKMPNLDGLRAFACIFVVISHIPKFGLFGSIGAVGVGVFFTLSGFLMGYLYAQRPCDPITVKKYAIARFARIVPIYWLVISVCVLISLLGAPNFPLQIDSLSSIIRHYGLGGNVGPFWSIPLEIQYYLFFVFLWFCLSVASTTRLWLIGAVILCALLITTNDEWPNLSLPNKLHFFLFGTIAGLLPREFWTKPARQGLLMGIQLLAVVAILVPINMGYSEMEFYDSLPISVAFAIAVYFISFDSTGSAKVFATRVIRKIGQASFSIYLIHVLILYAGAKLFDLSHTQFHLLWIPVGIAATALPIIVSHYIEMPLQYTVRQYLERTFASRAPIQAQQPG